MSTYTVKSVDEIPASSLEALRTAMQRLGVPSDWYDDLAWIMAQESGGRVGVHNSHSSAAGLYQLTKVNYSLMPHGAASIGDAVDECIGGISYVKQRYHTAAHAKQFWQTHHWY